MRMTRRLAIVIAVVCGLLAALLTYFYLSKLQQRAMPEAPAKNVELVTPLRDITAGTVIRSDMLGTMEIPQDEAVAGAVRSVGQITGQVCLVDLSAGQPITSAQVQSPTQLSYRVPEGMRAVTVAIDPVVGVAGFLKPGDRVDVIATFDIGEVTITRTVLQNVELLAIGTTATAAKPKKPPAEGEEADVEAAEKEQPNATLAVDPEQAQKLVLSDMRGKLRLALRPKFEEQYIALGATDTAKVIGEEFEDAIAALERPKPEADELPTGMGVPPPGPVGATLTREPRGPAVEVIRGTERQTVIIGGSQTSSSARGGQ